MTLIVVATVAGAVALPHFLPLTRATPMLGAAIWLCALALRALASVFAAIFVIFFFPATRLFGVVSYWCWHSVLPLAGMHLPLDGHEVGHAATLTPGVFVAISALSVIWALIRAARAVQDVLRWRALPGGPLGSLIVPDGEVVVAAAGIRRPKVVISAGALCAFDDDELAASVAHERGHIVHRHRFVLMFGELCRRIGRVVPGSSHALAQLHFHLERDADEYALARRHDPLALASAICKAAGASLPSYPALGLNGDGDLLGRLRMLTTATEVASNGTRRLAMIVAAGMATLTLALVAALPGVASDGTRALASAPPVVHCPL
jgi:Peptidase family M48